MKTMLPILTFYLDVSMIEFLGGGQTREWGKHIGKACLLVEYTWKVFVGGRSATLWSHTATGFLLLEHDVEDILLGSCLPVMPSL